MPQDENKAPQKKSHASLPWFRMYHEIIDDAKLRLLSPDCRWYYVGLLCCKAQGILDDHDGDLQWRMVAVKLGVSKDDLFDVVEELVEVGLIDRDTLQPIAWQKRQFRSDADPTAAERQRRYREKNKKKQASRVTDRNGNGRVTLTDTDTESDKDTDKILKPLSSSASEPDRVRQVFEHWQIVMDHPKAKLDDKRRAKIKKRLADGYTVRDLCAAVDGCKRSPHHMGENDRGTRYDDIELICRDAPHVDKFLKLAESPNLAELGSAGRQTANAAMEWINAD